MLCLALFQSLFSSATPRLRVSAGVGHELGRRGSGGELEACQVREAQDVGHLHVVDFVGGVSDVVIVGVKAGEPPEGGDVVQHKRELIAAEKNVERGVAVEAV